MAILSKSLKVKMALALVGCSMLACSERPSFFEMENLSAGSVVEALMIRKGKRGRDMNAATGGASDFEKRLRFVTVLDDISKRRVNSPTSVTSETNGPADVVEVGCEVERLCRSGQFMRDTIDVEGSVKEVISFANRFWKKPTYSAEELRQEASRIEKEAETEFWSWIAKMRADTNLAQKVHAFTRGAGEYVKLARRVAEEEAQKIELHEGQVVEEEAEEMKLVAEDENIDETHEDDSMIPIAFKSRRQLRNSLLATENEQADLEKEVEQELAARQAEFDLASKQAIQKKRDDNAAFEAAQQELKAAREQEKAAHEAAKEAAKQKTLADNARFAEELKQEQQAAREQEIADRKAEFEAKQAVEIQRARDQAAFEEAQKKYKSKYGY